MTEIKAGQVWKCMYYVRNASIFAITRSRNGKAHIIRNSGLAGSLYTANITNGRYMLLSTYPTWQEAVNSKEFNQ